MEVIQLIIVAALVINVKANLKTARGTCGDGTWTKYMDTKCIKLVEQYTSWTQAAEACNALSGQRPGSLLSIRFPEEQKFLTHFLFNTSGVVNNLWIGASKNLSENRPDFSWQNGEELSNQFTNWAAEFPTDAAGRDCVIMTSGMSKDGDVPGVWKNVNCGTGNWFVCETVQIWDDYETQLLIQALREAVDETQQLTQALREAVDELNKNPPVPLGFLYTELSGQPSPQTIWPQHKWEDVSWQYGGLFFRVNGGGSGPFGQVQDENAPRVTNVDDGEKRRADGDVSLPVGAWSKWLSAGEENWTGETASLAFYTSGGEVRPRNSAVRIWKRVP